MIPIPPNVKLVLSVILAGIVPALQVLGKLDTSLTWVGGLVSILLIVENALTAPSRTKS